MVRKTLGSLVMLGLALSLTLTLALTAVIPVSAQGDSPATVYVVHGIPGADLGLDPALPVDISVNGACALTAFPFGEIAGPLSLPAGSYDIAIGLANAEAPCSNAPVLQATVPLAAGENASVVAYLNTEGAPTAGKFTNNLSHLYASRLRVITHHTANAPTVDIGFIRQELVGDRLSSRKLRDVSNGMQGSVDVRPGTWDITLRPGGDPYQQIGPVTVPLMQQGGVYMVFAVGSLENGTFQVLLKQIK